MLALSADPPYTLLKEIDGSTTPAGKFLSQKGWISTAVDESSGHFSRRISKARRISMSSTGLPIFRHHHLLETRRDEFAADSGK